MLDLGLYRAMITHHGDLPVFSSFILPCLLLMFGEQLQSEAVLDCIPICQFLCSTFEANSTHAIFLAACPDASSKTFARRTHASMYA
jgi:hypothetical protein